MEVKAPVWSGAGTYVLCLVPVNLLEEKYEVFDI